jgi:hypothetical protein
MANVEDMEMEKKREEEHRKMLDTATDAVLSIMAGRLPMPKGYRLVVFDGVCNLVEKIADDLAKKSKERAERFKAEKPL